MEQLIEPLPFYDHRYQDFFPYEFEKEFQSSKPDKEKLLQIIKKHAKYIENNYPSYTQIYNNLIYLYRSFYDEKANENIHRFIMEPITGEQKYYSTDNVSGLAVKDLKPDQVWNYLNNASNFSTEDLQYLLKFGLSREHYPRAKLEIIRKLLAEKVDFVLPEHLTKDLNADEKILFSENKVYHDLPMEKWTDLQNPLIDLLQKSDTHTLNIDNDKCSTLMLYRNSDGVYLFDVKEQTFTFNGETRPITDIYEYTLINMCLIGGKLIFIGRKNYTVQITKFENDKVPTKPNMILSINTGVDISNLTSSCHIYDHQLYIYSSGVKIRVFDLDDLTETFDSPDYYFLSSINSENNRIFTLNAKNNEVFVDYHTMTRQDMYVTIIRPSFCTSCLTAAAMIAADMISELTTSFIALINNKNISNDYVFDEANNIENGLNFYKEIHETPIPEGLLNLYRLLDILAIRFTVLNIRQCCALNQPIAAAKQKAVSQMLSKTILTVPYLDSLDMLFRTIKYGIYWPSLIRELDKDYFRNDIIDISQLVDYPQRLFVDFSKVYENIEDPGSVINLLKQSYYDMYTIIKLKSRNTRKTTVAQNTQNRNAEQTENEIAQESTANEIQKQEEKVLFDEEFANIVQVSFKIINKFASEVNTSYAVQLFKELMKILSVIPIGLELAQVCKDCINIMDNLSIMFDSKKFKSVNKYFASDKFITDLNVSSLYTTIFAPKDHLSDYKTTLHTPYLNLKITDTKFENGQGNANILFNLEAMPPNNPSKVIDGEILDIQIIGNPRNSQFELDGITMLPSDDSRPVAKDTVPALYPYFLQKVAKKLLIEKPKTLFETQFEKILLLKDFNFESNEKISQIRQSLEDIFYSNNFSTPVIDKFISITTRVKINSSEVKKVLAKLVATFIWSAGYFEEFIKYRDSGYDKVNADQKIKDLGRKIGSFATELGSQLQRAKKENSFSNFNQMVENFEAKTRIIFSRKYVETNDDKAKQERVDLLFEFFKLNVELSEFQEAQKNRSLRITLPQHSAELLNGFFEIEDGNDMLYEKFPSLYRAFIQMIDFASNELKESIFETALGINDPCINLHLVQFFNDSEHLTQISDQLKECDVLEIKLMKDMLLAINPKRKSAVNIPISANPSIKEITTCPSLSSYIPNSNIHLVATYINQIRKWNVNKILELINNNGKELKEKGVSDESLTAMIALGAEIFTSAITRFVMVNGEKTPIAKASLNDQRNSKAVFEQEIPNIPINKELIETVKNLLSISVDLDTNDCEAAVKNCIIISFLCRLFDLSSNKQTFSKNFLTEMTKIKVKVTNVNAPNLTNAKYCQLIRNSVSMTLIKEKVDERFIALTHCSNLELQANQISGSEFGVSFFVYTKPVENLDGMKFKLSGLDNILKYVGFVGEDWNPIFLSMFDKNIYTEKEYTHYNGSCCDFTISCNEKYLDFGNTRIDCGEFKKRWFFIITIADPSIIQYELIKAKGEKKQVAQMIPHDFDIKAIFPRICLGKNVSLPGFCDVYVLALETDYRYKIHAIHGEKNSYDEFTVSDHQLKAQTTPFDTVIQTASLAYKVGNPEVLKQQHLDICKKYSVSLLNTLMVYYSDELIIDTAINMLAKLTVSSSKEDCNAIIEVMVNKKQEVLASIVKKLQECDNDASTKKFSTMGDLQSSPSGKYQLAYFFGWFHQILIPKTFDNGIKFIFDYKKTCTAFIPYITQTFKSSIPNDLNMAKLYLQYFDLPQITEPIGNFVTFRDYLNNLVTFIFKKDPSIITRNQGHSSIITRSANDLINGLLAIVKDTSKGFARMPPLIMYAHSSAVGPRWEKALSRIQDGVFYPIEVKKFDNSISVINPNDSVNWSQIKCYRYFFGNNAQQILTDWTNHETKNYSDCMRYVCMQVIKHKVISKNLMYPPLILYFCHLCVSKMTEIPIEYFDLDTPRNKLYSKLTFAQTEGISQLMDLAENKQIPYLQIDIFKTHSYGVPYDKAIRIIDVLAKPESNFPYKLIRFRQTPLFYFTKYFNTTGLDCSGLFKDSFCRMIEELMDLKFGFFSKPPPTLAVPNDALIPSINLSPQLAKTIGAVISGAICTNTTAKQWNVAQFILDYLVSPDNTNLSELVDCADSSYLNALSRLMVEMKKGFNYYLPYNHIKEDFSGEYLKILMCGPKTELDYNTFTSFIDPNCSRDIVAIFKSAITNFNKTDFEKLLFFITGSDTPKVGKDFKIAVRQSPKARNLSPNQNEWDFPESHTCFNVLDIFPYTDAEILRKKLLFAIYADTSIDD